MQNNIFTTKHIILDSNAKTVKEVFTEIANLAKKLGFIDDSNVLVSGFEKRELESTTGFEDGFAIPHARIKEVKKEAIFLLRLKKGIDWKSMDGKPTNVAIALVVPEKKSKDIHLQMLSQVAKKLLNEEFKENMRKETNLDRIVKYLLETKEDNKPSEKVAVTKGGDKLILAITACATGIAHTFLAEDRLIKSAPELGYKIKVETHGAEGVRNNFTEEEIKKAEVIIIASDIGIETSRFGGKKVYNCAVAKAIKVPNEIINSALKDAKLQEGKPGDNFSSSNANVKVGVMKHLMSGVSYMIPVVILGGILLAISLGLSKAIYGNTFDPSKHRDNFFYYTNVLGVSAFTMMIPILGAMIANSIAGKAAIAPALVVSFIGNDANNFWEYSGFVVTTPTGFIGAILVGLAVGYTTRWINSWKVHKSIRPIMPIIFIPIVLGFVYGMLMMFIVGAGIGYVMGQFGWFIQHYWGGNVTSKGSIAVGLGFGILVGAMIGFDMGGPINKIAFLTAAGLISQNIYTPMGAVACAIPVAPLGMGLATLVYRSHFSKDERTLGISAIIMGFIGISEGAIPFAINDPKRAIPCNILGSAVAGGLAGVAGIADLAAQGGPIMGFLGALGKGNGSTGQYGWVDGWEWTLIAFLIMAIGAAITGLTYVIWLGLFTQGKKEKVNNDIQ